MFGAKKYDLSLKVNTTPFIFPLKLESMRFFDVFSKKERDELSDEEKQTLEDITTYQEPVEKRGEELTIGHKPSITEFVSSLSSLEEINKVRNALDAKEEQITGKRPHVDDLVKENSENKTTTPVETPDVAQEEPSQDESQEEQSFDVEEVEDIHSIEIPPKKEESSPEFMQKEVPEEEIKENNTTQEQIDEDYVELNIQDIDEKSQFEIESELFLEYIQDIFGKDNVFHKLADTSDLEYLQGKPIFHIGIRNKDFFTQEVPVSEQNYWFVSFVKKIENLSKFKFIRSEEGMKDLVWEKHDGFIVLSFRATQYLNSLDEFDFDL